MARIAGEYQYCIVYDDKVGTEELEPDYSFDSIWDEDDVERLAEDAAEDYHSHHDGWEAFWPVKFAIFKDGTVLGKFEVELEHSPSFSAGVIV
jgi:hypothetical protein